MLSAHKLPLYYFFVTGLVVPLGPLMQGLLETLGLTVAGHLVHGQVKVVPLVRVRGH